MMQYTSFFQEDIAYITFKFPYVGGFDASLELVTG